MVLTKGLRTKRELQQGYNKDSLTYDAKRFSSPGGEYLDEVEKQTLSRFLTGVSVLELGTGTGRYGIFLRKKGYDFIGIDIAKDMLKVAKKKAVSEGLEANWIVADAENLPFGDRKLDNVICIHTFQYFSHPLNALREAFRVLKPGGICIVSFESDYILEGKFRMYFRHPCQRFYNIDEVKALFEGARLKPTYQKSLFVLPLGLYRRLPEFFIKIIEMFDNRLNIGSLSFVAGKRPR